MSAIDELLANNADFAASRPDRHLDVEPSRHLAIVTCMDSRLDVFAALGLGDGEAHVLRNAGGVISDDVIRSLAISQRLLGTREVMLIHHTDCGMLTFSNRELRAKVQEDLGQDTGEFDFLPFTDLEGSVREDIEFLQATQLLDPATVFRGFVYDVRSGRLTEVRQEVEAGG